VCSAKGPLSQFTSCPPGVSCSVYPGFADWCTASGGFVDGIVNSLSECAIAGTVSVFVPCNGSTTGCTYSGLEFNQTCQGLGGMITAVVNGLPVCQVIGKVGIIEPCPGQTTTTCSYATSEFLASCGRLGGLVMKNGGSNRPQCAFKDGSAEI